MRLLLIIISFLFISTIVAQEEQQNDEILEKLIFRLEKGERKALRDLVSLMDEKSSNKQIINTLQAYTLFLPEEIDIHKAKKEAILEFYYQNESKFYFDPISNAYYITPLEQRKTTFKVESTGEFGLKNKTLLFKKYQEELQAGDILKTKEQILEQIAALKIKQSEQFLLEIIQNPKSDFYLKACQFLSYYPSLKNLDVLLQQVKKGTLKINEIKTTISNISNLHLSVSDPKIYFNWYKDQMEDKETIEALQELGFEYFFQTRPQYFVQLVDYYGYLYNQTGAYYWTQTNAERALLKTKQSRGLYFIAAKLISHKHIKKEQIHSIIKKLEKLTNLQFYTADNQRLLEANVENWKLKKDFVAYWARHQNEFEWDDTRGFFINKNIEKNLSKTYEKYFQLLNSKNTKAAKEAFVNLTQGDPILIAHLAEKFRNLLQNQNTNIPPLQYYYLENLSEFVQYAKENNILLQHSTQVQHTFDQLASYQGNIYTLENKIIETLNLKTIHNFEYNAFLYHHKQVSFSISRILDVFYSKNWLKLINNEEHFRAYLKKASLFKSIGTIGSCNSYLQKIDIKQVPVVHKLRLIQQHESDNSIIAVIQKLLNSSKTPQGYNSKEIDRFITSPLSFNKRVIKTLPPPKKSDVKQIFKKLNNPNTPQEINLLYNYLELHSNISFVPNIFELLKSKRRKYAVLMENYAVLLLENIYDFEFSSEENKHEDWLVYWKKNKTSYKDWGKQFLSFRIEKLQSQKQLSIETINEILQSQHYDQNVHEKLIFGVLKNLKTPNDILKLNLKSKIKDERYLAIFEKIDFHYKKIDNLSRFFDLPPQKLFSFLHKKIDPFSNYQKGYIFMRLFRQYWFESYILKNQDDTISKQIKSYINTYLQESQFISEYEEEQVYLRLAQLQIGTLPITQKIPKIIEFDLPIESKEILFKNILSQISFDELKEITPYFEQINTLCQSNIFSFLKTDFGLPIEQFNRQENRNQFIKNINTLTEKALYLKYLQKYELNLYDSDKLDYKKIYNILKYDTSFAFENGGGEIRDDYVYPTIKILELEHQTTLGFHKKLNENQHFYIHNSRKRAKAWMRYLEKNNLVDFKTYEPPSFKDKE